MSIPNANDNWPPKSPHQARISTPGGRDKIRRRAELTSPTPSSSKRPRSAGQAMQEMMAESEDDDEETLELKLQEIQARLKLKKLQKKAKQNADLGTEEVAVTAPPPQVRADPVAASRAQSRMADLREGMLQRSKSQASIQVDVPVSPVRRLQPAADIQTSPKRVLLGIDKGIRASEVSLKRAPSLRRQDSDLKGPFLQRAGSQASSRNYGNGGSSQNNARNQPKSFNERLLATRAQESERQERDRRIRENRSKAFEVDHKKLQDYKEAAVELPPAPPEAVREFTKEEILESFHRPVKSIPKSRTAPNLESSNPFMNRNVHDNNLTSNRADSVVSIGRSERKSKSDAPPSDVSETEASSFEPFSSVHLSRRFLPHKELTRILSGKKTFVLPDLLRDVKAPGFSGPDIEEDLVLFAIIATKSDPKSHQENASNKNANRGKFMIMTLTDLKWELDLFLFDTAFDQYWKLTPGTIISILNPGFMPPQKGKEATGRFSLTLNSNSDTILEIGSARDLGFCKSVRKDGKVCSSWIDKRHTEFCSFHVNLAVERTQSNRMELNTMTFGKGRGRGGGGGFGDRRQTSAAIAMERREREKQEEKTRYDRASHSQIYISKRTTASMLDDVDYNADAFHRGSKEERINKQLLVKEKERELAKALGGGLGNGIGADYMRKRINMPDPSREGETQAPPPPDAAALGLLGGRGKDMLLGPVKRKRTNTVSGSAAIGWGGQLTKELGRMREGENLLPVKKKTRFVTEKGIREAGRESIGGEAANQALLDDDDDDDDDLDIVRE